MGESQEVRNWESCENWEPGAGLGFRAGGGGWLEGRRYGGQRGVLGGGWQEWGVEMMKICGMIVQDMHLKVLGEKPGCRPPHP